MAGFSTAANAFSVVGLADIVLRLGVNTASLYSRYRNASKNIASLVDEIQDFVGTIAQIRLYLVEYRQSPYAQGDGQSLPPHLSKTLCDCEKVLQDLQQLADRNKSEPQDGLAIQMMKSWRWTFQNEHVSKSCKRIRHLNMNLQTFLVLIGRNNGIVLRKELKATREDINSAGLTMHQALHTMDGNLCSNQERTNALVRNQTTLISQMIKISEDHHQDLLKLIPSLTVEQSEGDDFIFHGDNLDSIVFPLLLIKSDLFKTIKALQEENVLKLSRSEAQWIIQNFENLLARGHEAAARDLKGGPRNDDRKGLFTSFNMKRGNFSSKHEQEDMVVDSKFSAFDQIGRIRHTSIIYSPSGVLILETGSSNKPLERHQESADFQVIRLSFFPKPEFSSINIRMLLTNEFGRNRNLRIPRLIQTYNTIPHNSEIYKLIIRDDARGLESLFIGGQCSPNDIFESGISLSEVASVFQSIAVCEFLFREGASASMFHPMSDGQSTGLLFSIWYSHDTAFHHTTYLTVSAAVENALHLTNLAIKHGCDPNMVSFPDQANVIHVFISISYLMITAPEVAIKDPSRPYNGVQLSVNKYREIFASLVGMGCDLEGRTGAGLTALFYACLWLHSRPQLNMTMALVDIGADVNATDNEQNGVLHFSFFANKHRLDLELQDSEDNLYHGLVMLLDKKVDPNKLNDSGLSPSDYARDSPKRLNAWMKAIKCARYEIMTLRLGINNTDSEENMDYEYEEILVVVSAGSTLSGSTTLPVSNMTLDGWLEKRSECRSLSINASSAEGKKFRTQSNISRG